jgi:hypothetical protein
MCFDRAVCAHDQATDRANDVTLAVLVAVGNKLSQDHRLGHGHEPRHDLLGTFDLLILLALLSRVGLLCKRFSSRSSQYRFSYGRAVSPSARY